MKKSVKFISIVLSSFLLISLAGCPNPNTINKTQRKYSCSNELSEAITSTVTLTAGKTYLVDKSISVESGGTLNIPEGTVLKFSENGQLVAYKGGKIHASGAYFTSIKDNPSGSEKIKGVESYIPAAGDWKNVLIYGGEATFYECTFAYGGASKTYQNSVLSIAENGTAEIEKCIFQNNGTKEELENSEGAIYFKKTDPASSSIKECTFKNNIWPISAPFYFNFEEDAGIFIDNKYQGIKINHTTIETDTTWTYQKVPYCLMDENNDYIINKSLTITGGDNLLSVEVKTYKINKITIKSKAHLYLGNYTKISGYNGEKWGGIQFKSKNGTAVTATYVLDSNETLNIVITDIEESSKIGVPAKEDNSSE